MSSWDWYDIIIWDLTLINLIYLAIIIYALLKCMKLIHIFRTDDSCLKIPGYCYKSCCPDSSSFLSSLRIIQCFIASRRPVVDICLSIYHLKGYCCDSLWRHVFRLSICFRVIAHHEVRFLPKTMLVKQWFNLGTWGYNYHYGTT